MIETRNVVITSTMLGIEDHGILTAFLNVQGDGWGCGFGGYSMDAWDEAKKRRVGTAYGTEFILRVMDVVGVEKWEDLKGKHIRCETQGLGHGISRIGNIVKDKWFDPKELAEAMK